MATGNTQQIIDYGASANDGTGDPLRTAFIKTDENFDNIWLAGPVGSNISIVNNTIGAINTNGNIVLSPNGIGVIQTNNRLVPRLDRTYDIGASNLRYRNVYANMFMGNATLGNASSITLDVGDLHILGGSNGYVLQTDGAGNLTWIADQAGAPGGANTQVQFNNAGNFGGTAGFTFNNTTGNLSIPGKILTIASLAGNANAASNAGISINGANAGIIYDTSEQGWTFNKHVKIKPDNGSNIWYFGNSASNDTLVFPSGAMWQSNATSREEYLSSTRNGYINMQTYDAAGNLASQLHMEHGLVHLNVFNGTERQWEFNEDGTTHVPGSIIPDTSNVYSLGNATNQWNDLYVSNTTIFMNNVPISLSAGNVLTVNGNAVLQNNSNTAISTTGNITSGNVLTGGIVSATGNVSGGFILGNLAFANGLPATYGNSNVTTLLGNLGSNVISGTGNITTTANISGAYVKGNGSELTNLPAPTVTQDITSNGAMSIMTYDGVIKYVNYATVEPSSGNIAGGNISAIGNVAGNFFLGNGSQLTGISTANTGNVTFNDVNIIGDGNLNLQPNGASNEYLDIYLTGNADIHVAAGGSGGNLILGTDEEANVAVLQGGNVAIQAGNVAGTKTWTFDTAGNLTLPGNIIGSGNILIAPDSASSSSYLDIYLTGGPDIHIASNDNSIVIGRDTGANIFVGNDGEVSIRTDNGVTSQVWNFDDAGNLTLPMGSIVYETNIPDGALSGSAIALKPTGGTTANQQLLIYPTANDGDHIHMTSGNLYTTELFLGSDNLYVKLANTGNVVVNTNDNAGNTAQWNFDTTGNLTLPDTTSVLANVSIRLEANDDGNITGLSVIGDSHANLYAHGNITLYANTGGAGSTWRFDNAGNLTLPGNTFAVNYANGTAVSLGGNYGNANVATFLAAYGSNTISTSGNVTAGNFVGNGAALSNVTVSVAGNIIGTQSNVTLVAGSYNWTFNNTGNLTLPGNTFAVNYANNTPVDVVTRFESSWTVPVGNSTQSFTVTASNTYYMWVDCNIPNGILVWNATGTVTNTNVPVVGYQYAWVYNGGGTPIDFTSIPDQFVGTANAIVRSNVSPSSTTNRFDFGINNTSGGNVTVRYGWIAIS